MNDETPESWEQIRRSVAMLAPGAWAFRREQALEALSTLIGVLHQLQDDATTSTIDRAGQER